MSLYGSELYGSELYGFEAASSSNQPTLLLEYTTDDVSDTSPTWVDASALVRSFNISRGRESELAEVQPGTAQVVLDNRDRDFDPTVNPGIRPMNRWRFRVVHVGGTDDLFFGYAESYQQDWPAAGGRDAVCVVSLVDEFKVLALDKLPTTDPPRDSYQDLVLFDAPSAFYPMLSPNWSQSVVGGEDISFENSVASVTGVGGVVGQAQPGFIYLQQDGYLTTPPLRFGSPLDVTALSEITIEALIAIDGTPGSAEILIRGPMGVPSSTDTWQLRMNTSRQLGMNVRNSGGTDHTVTSTTALTSSSIGASMIWYHVVGTIEGGSLRLYVNGVQEASTAWSGVLGQIEDNGSQAKFIIGNNGTTISPNIRMFDEVAFYKYGLSASRVLAHYNAARFRGFERGEDPGDRIEAVLDAASSVAARNVRPGSRNMAGRYMTGQSPLDEIRQAELADNVDAVFFVAKDGTVTFLDDGHRSVSPWNTVQATFDDDGTDLPYLSVTVDYSESFLANEIVVNKLGGALVTDDDATSIAEFFKRTMSLGELPITTDADVTSIAAALLAKYKDPMTRVTGLSLTTGHDGIAQAVFPLEIGDRIRVLRTPPYAGGARIDQTVFIQKITVSATAHNPYWNITLSVSPL